MAHKGSEDGNNPVRAGLSDSIQFNEKATVSQILFVRGVFRM